MSQTATAPAAGHLLRHWRRRRRMTQLELSLRADVSARHLSFLETGRSSPSRGMLLRLAEHLDVPLRERNALLTAAGYAPAYSENTLDDPQMRAVRAAIDRLLAGHEPYPAVVVDRWWTMVAANRSLAVLTAGLPPALLEPPVNVLRASLHPDGLARRIRNRAQWRAHLLSRLRRQIDRTGDPGLTRLLDELLAFDDTPVAETHTDQVVVPLHVTSDVGDLNLLSTVATFGTAVDITVADLSIESFFPLDDTTRARLEAATRQSTAGDVSRGPAP
ncbi:MAG TPA: helix-turn-helix transcriptional regulator [Euzebyales bacterium]|nr:helix-turn-helix transcriptional regulator [Euzebyales bacterium]